MSTEFTGLWILSTRRDRLWANPSDGKVQLVLLFILLYIWSYFVFFVFLLMTSCMKSLGCVTVWVQSQSIGWAVDTPRWCDPCAVQRQRELVVWATGQWARGIFPSILCGWWRYVNGSLITKAHVLYIILSKSIWGVPIHQSNN